MKEYKADCQTGKKLYKKYRKNYWFFKYGMGVVSLLCVAAVLLNIAMVRHGQNIQEVREILIVCIGFDAVFWIGVGIVYAAAVSGGWEVLVNRVEETCRFEDDCLTVAYMPDPCANPPYQYVVVKMLYRDIEKIMTIRKSMGEWRSMENIVSTNTRQKA